jgi:hypothetical protein
MTNKCLALRAASIISLLSAYVPSATATSFDFFEASSAKGSPNWFDPDNLNAYNAWRTAIGEVPDFGEDWDGSDWLGNPWADNRLFDVQDIPTAIFVDGVTFSNVGADSTRHAAADDAPGSTDAIDNFALRGDESGESTIFFPNYVDYLGFYTFDTDNPVTYFVQFSNGDLESIGGKETDEDRYRFVGFVNRHPTAQIASFWVEAERGSRYGIDELEWGRTEPPRVLEPGTVWMFTAGVGLLLYRKRRPRASTRR